MPLKVYYLDDEQALLDIFYDHFASPQVEVTTFTDPQKAIATIKSSPPDLLFLDFRLPNTTGLIIAQQLDPAIPKILITGDLSIEQNSIFQRTLEKPLDIEVVERLIADIAQKKKTI